jgi:hypothetical protein
VANGGSATAFSAFTNAVDNLDTLTFSSDASATMLFGAHANQGTQASPQAGINAALLSGTGATAHEVYYFMVGSNAWLYEHAVSGSSQSASDTLLELVGISSLSHIHSSGSANGLITL